MKDPKITENIMIVADDLTGFINGPYKSDMTVCRDCFNKIFDDVSSLRKGCLFGFAAIGTLIAWHIFQQKQIDDLEAKLNERELDDLDFGEEFTDKDIDRNFTDYEEVKPD